MMRKLRNGNFHILYYAPDVIKMIKSKKTGGQAMCHACECEKSIQVVARKPERNRTLGRPRYRWDIIKIDLNRNILRRR